MKRSDFYAMSFVNWLSGGSSIKQIKLSLLDIIPTYLKIITRKSCKTIIEIKKFPVDYDRNIQQDLRNVLAIDCKEIDSAHVYTNYHMKRCNINVTSDKFRQKMARAEARYNEYKDVIEDLTDSEQLSGAKLRTPDGRKIRITRKELENRRDNYNSYKYTFLTATQKKSFMVDAYVFIEVVANDYQDNDKVLKAVSNYLDTYEFYYEIKRNCLTSYLKSFSPATIRREPPKDFSTIMLSTENIVDILPYRSKGFLGDGYGIVPGYDIEAQAPLDIDFFATDARRIIALIAASGWGKTVEGQIMALGFIQKRLHCSVIDIKGDEWENLGRYTKYKKIDISESSPYYVNTWRLDDLPIDKSNCASFYNMAKQSTLTILNIIVNISNKDERTTANIILREAIDKTYRKFGVDQSSPRTFYYSKNIRYADILPVLEDMRSSKSLQADGILIDKLKNRLNSIISNTDLFKGEELTVGDILESPLIIYALNKNSTGVGGQDEETMMELIRTYMITTLDMKKISIRKSQRKGTVCFYEELQRKDEFKTLISFICGVVTGGRSSNVAVVLLLNNINVLNDPDLSAIKSNLSSFIVGDLGSEDNYPILESIGAPEIVDRVDKIMSDKSVYNNCFAVKSFNGINYIETIIKCELPPDVLQTLKTGNYSRDA